MAKKSHLNTAKTAPQAEKKIPAVLASHSTRWRDEEDLVDYESETPPSFSPVVEEFSEPEDLLLCTPVSEQADSSSPEYEFGGKAADDAPMAGQKRRPNSPQGDELRRKAPKDESAAHPKKGGKSVIPGKTGRQSGKPTNKHFGGK
jgi:hypothetical protein